MKHSDRVNVREEGAELWCLSLRGHVPGALLLRRSRWPCAQRGRAGGTCPGLGRPRVTRNKPPGPQLLCPRPPGDHGSHFSAASPALGISDTAPRTTRSSYNSQGWWQNLEEIINNYFTGEGSSWSSIWWLNIYLTKDCYLSNNP